MPCHSIKSFLIALALLIVGSGCLKGNISAQVGQLYPPNDGSQRRTRGFTIFSAGINIGAVLGPLACGAVAAIYGWHAGFRTNSRADDRRMIIYPASAISPTAAFVVRTNPSFRR